MELSYMIAVQVGILFLLIAVGFALAKMNIVTETGVKQMTDILLMVVTPCVLISAYQKEFDIHLVWGLLMAAVFSVLIHVIGIVLASLVFRKEPSLNYRINIFSAVYSNCGFMAIPLLQAILGNDGVFYGSAYLAVFTLFYWTHGVYLYTGDKKQLSLRKTLLNPGIIGVVLGLTLFFTRIRLPYVVLEGVRYMASLNTPVAMIILGTFLAKIDLLGTLKHGALYLVNFLRLIAIPLIGVALAKWLRLDETVLRAVILCAACPTATVTTLFAAKFGLNASHASEVVTVSTLLSIVSIPLVMLLC